MGWVKKGLSEEERDLVNCNYKLIKNQLCSTCANDARRKCD